MQQATYPISKDLVLIGGGHSHAIVLKMFGMKPIPGVRLTLITDTSHTPYSGMLPGHVAGFYSYDETHIDLQPLANFAQAQLYLDQAIGLDLENNQVICANHPPVSFDYLSIDIGSTPATISTPGAAEYAIPAKPVPQFLAAWNQIIETVKHNPQSPVILAIVGGGAGGVELALNMQSRLQQLLTNQNLQIHLFQRGNKLLPHHNNWVGNRLEKILLQRGIKLHLPETVREIHSLNPLNKEGGEEKLSKIICNSGLNVECNYIFWVTQASPQTWLKASGLATDNQGFVLVEDTLQSVSHPHIFAAGDIATMKNYIRPKAGVFAVRQGKPLFENLQRIILRKSLIPYVPQKQYLSLIGTGDKKAIASWSCWGWHSPLLWRWKDYIDRKFMVQFDKLNSMKQNETKANFISLRIYPKNLFTLPQNTSKINNQIYCHGCGSKVGSNILDRVLQRLPVKEREDIFIGLKEPDDGAIIKVPEGKLLVQTTDYFSSLINDPFIFGQIATNHCLSDIFAMGATPHSALAIATIPYGTATKVEETLYQLMSGATKVLQECQTSLIGGHTTEGLELAFGLACNGLVSPEKILRKSGMQPGQILLITKAIGTGTIFAADMRNQAKGRWIEQAVASMLLSNQAAAKVLLECGATACTDITGFGLLGHLSEMVKASGVAIELNLEAIPILPGAIETLSAGIISSLHSQNLQFSLYVNNSSNFMNLPKYQLLFDPQTSGGLLASIPAAKANKCIAKLQEFGYQQSCLIGRLIVATEAKPITL